jgi:Zn-dependent peptidase ImmA (M78 family)
MGGYALPDKLLDLAKRNGINLMFWDFQPPIEAIYYYYPGKNPVIGIDRKLKNNIKNFRCILAEELGHFFTTDQGNMVSHYHLHDKIQIYREEYKAMKWAVNYLIPDEELEIAFNTMSPWELEDYFQVNSDFMAFKLKLYKDKLLTYLT